MDILSNIHQNHEEIQEHERNTQYKYRVTMDASSWKTLVDALDVYSRILMGQFSIIYEELDISGDDEYICGQIMMRDGMVSVCKKHEIYLFLN